MFYGLRLLTWRDYAVVVTGLAIVVLLGLGGANITTFPPDTATPPLPAVEMPEQTVRAFDRHYAGGAYFGAFATGSDGAFGWTTAHSTLNAARANALAHCGRKASDCRIVSELTPAGYRAESQAVTLRYRNAVAFQAYLERPGAKAFAVAENGAFGMSYGAMTIFHARAQAMANCQALVGQNQPDYLPAWPCRIIQSSLW